MRRVVLLLVVLAACQGSSHKEGATVTVTMKAMKFDPQDVTLHVGDTVVFDNQDTLVHNVVGKGLFNSGQLDPKKSWQITLVRAGEYPYWCTIHPAMVGKITVQ